MSRHGMPDPPETLERPELHARLLDTLVPGALGAQKLSETATATVFRVVGPDLGSVAVKIIDPHLVPPAAALFARAGRHRALVPLLGEGELQGMGYLIHPYYGRTLADRIETGPIPPAELAQLLHPVAAALDQLHQAGLVHADVKPSNIMLDSAGSAVLTDLDEAAPLGTAPRRVTVGFCPPEQVSGARLAVENDTYAFAATVVTALTGGTGWMADAQGWLRSAEAQRLPATTLAALPATTLAALRAALSPESAARRTGGAQLVELLAAGDPPAVGNGYRPDSADQMRTATRPELLVSERQVLSPRIAEPEPVLPPGAALAPTATAHAASELAAAAQQAWGFVDLRAVTQDRLPLQLREPEPEPEEQAEERSIWRSPAMIVSLALAGLLILVAIVLMALR